MTTEEFNKKSCELIEEIQDLEIRALLLRQDLLKLKKTYTDQKNEEAKIKIFADDFIKFANDFNKAIEDAAANSPLFKERGEEQQ